MDICGLSTLDETEIETIPAQVKSAPSRTATATLDGIADDLEAKLRASVEVQQKKLEAEHALTAEELQAAAGELIAKLQEERVELNAEQDFLSSLEACKDKGDLARWYATHADTLNAMSPEDQVVARHAYGSKQKAIRKASAK